MGVGLHQLLALLCACELQPSAPQLAGQKSEGLQEVVARLQLEQDRLRAALDAQAGRCARLRDENAAMEARLASLAHVQVRMQPTAHVLKRHLCLRLLQRVTALCIGTNFKQLLAKWYRSMHHPLSCCSCSD